MTVLGVSCSIKDKRPVVLGVTATDDEAGEVSAVEAFRHFANRQDKPSTQLRQLSDHLDTVLRKLQPSVVVVRTLDFSKLTSRETIRKRAMVEGALLVIADKNSNVVAILNGKQIGEHLGATKADADQNAVQFVGEELAEAGAAALAALALAKKQLESG